MSYPRARRWRPLLLLVCPPAFIALGAAIDASDPFPRLRVAVQRPTDTFPSTTAMPALDVIKGLPTMSVYLDPHHLYDRTAGILANRTQTGRDWERPATMSYFDGGRLVFATGAGIRVHGGGSRLGNGKSSFRLYFRREYGAAEFPAGALFAGRRTPLRQLVLDRDADANRGLHLVNALAYDVARRIGCITVRTKPVRFMLNGEFQGVYVLTERINDRFLESRFGHGAFLHDAASFEQLPRWLAGRRSVRMRELEEVVDVDNLTRWYLSVLLLGTADAYQGPGQFRDAQDPEARWFFVNWDMDGSFARVDGADAVESDPFRLLLRGDGEPSRRRRFSEVRPYLLQTLLAEDERYREYFKRVFAEVMNHKVTPAFLMERFSHYKWIALVYGVEHRGYLDELEVFLRRRPALLRRFAEEHLNTEPSNLARVRSPAGLEVLVDGHRVHSGFEGHYFPGVEVEVAVASSDRSRFSHWLVNGERSPETSSTLRLVPEIDVTIEAVGR